MQPLKVTAYLQTGQVVSTDGYLPLDSILAAAWMQKNRPDLFYNDGMKAKEILIPELPFQKENINSQWFWACSFAQYEKQAETVAYWHKRFDAILAEKHVDFGKKRGAVNVKSAKYKNYRMPMVNIITEKIEWYCVGDLEQVKELVNMITAIGKKRSQGYGLVDEWTVESWPEDWSIYGPKGKFMRAIPDSNGSMIWGVRPPYWYHDNQVMCQVP
jgi:CRISPR type IV-associated protein Csf3